MKTLTFLITLFLFAGPQAFSSSLLQCTNNQNIQYLKKNNAGGMRPPGGNIRQVEEVSINSEVLYRTVLRTLCEDSEECTAQDPDLVDIHPDDFSFSFYPETKVTLSTSGSTHGPVFKETYAIQFRINRRVNVWMLCDDARMMKP
jgi:hypothetical protein